MIASKNVRIKEDIKVNLRNKLSEIVGQEIEVSLDLETTENIDLARHV